MQIQTFYLAFNGWTIEKSTKHFLGIPVFYMCLMHTHLLYILYRYAYLYREKWWIHIMQSRENIEVCIQHCPLLLRKLIINNLKGQVIIAYPQEIVRALGVSELPLRDPRNYPCFNFREWRIGERRYKSIFVFLVSF